jgi:hypothetical protein
MANRIYQVCLTYLTRLRPWVSIFSLILVLSLGTNWLMLVMRFNSAKLTSAELGRDVSILQMLGVLWPINLLSQLKAQFLQPSARLIPSFAFPHLVVASVFSGAYVALQVFAMWRGGCEIIPSLAMVLLIPNIWIIFNFFSEPTTFQNKILRIFTRAGQWASHVFLIGCVGASLFLETDFNSFVGQLARGEQPLAAAILILWELLFHGLLIRRCLRLSFQLEEESAFPSPRKMAVDPKWDWQEPSTSQLVTTGYSRSQAARSKRLETALAMPAPHSALRLSIAANSHSGMQGALMAVCCCLIAFLVFSGAEIFPIQMRAPLITGKELFPIIVWCLFHFLGLSIATAWSEHCPVLRMEMLRPISRQQLIRQTFVNVAIDLAPIWFCQFILILASLCLWPQQCQIPGWLLAVAVCFVSSAIFIYSLVHYSILYGNSPYLAFVLIFTILNLIGAGFFLFPEEPSILDLLFPQICWLIGALLFLYVMWCHWQTAEFD